MEATRETHHWVARHLGSGEHFLVYDGSGVNEAAGPVSLAEVARFRTEPYDCDFEFDLLADGATEADFEWSAVYA